MKRRIIALLLTLLMCAALLAPVASAEGDYAWRAFEIGDYISRYSLAYKNSGSDPLFDALMEVLEDDPELFSRLVDAMFGNLDKYSMYLTEEEYDAAYSNDASYVGVGITLDSGYPFGSVVSGVAPHGPAAEAGIQAGDVIVSVDGVNVGLYSTAEIVPLVRGENGTTVKMTLLRQHVGRIEVELERQIIHSAPNVTYEYAGDGVGIIYLSYFGGIRDYLMFAEAYNEFADDERVKSVIIDLRGNPGGSVDALHAMLDVIVAQKNVTLFTLASSEEEEIYKTAGSAVWTPDKLIILINGRSMSASEVFAGSLQKLGLAEVVGEGSGGKARSQYHFDLSDGSVAVISSHEVILPGGGTYEGVGITPDFVVSNDGKPYPQETLGALNTNTPLYKGRTSNAVLAMQQRLSALGLYPAEPDGYFGEITLWALNIFQKAAGLRVTSHATAETLRELEKEVKEARVYEDAQMEFALERAKES